MEEQPSTDRDKPGFEDLYSSTRPDLVRLAHVITGSNHVAEEVVQDAFLALHVRWERIDNPGTNTAMWFERDGQLVVVRADGPSDVRDVVPLVIVGEIPPGG